MTGGFLDLKDVFFTINNLCFFSILSLVILNKKKVRLLFSGF